MTYDWTLTGKMKQGGNVFNRNAKVTLEFSDYGTPVRVERPANVVVDDR
jgi:predicted porin